MSIYIIIIGQSDALSVSRAWSAQSTIHRPQSCFGQLWGHNCVKRGSCQSKFFSVAKIAELLQGSQRYCRVTVQNQEMTVEKNYLGVDGKQVGMEMTECQMAVSSTEVMQRLERSIDRRLWVRTVAQAAAVTMKSNVGGDRVVGDVNSGSDRVALVCVMHEMPWQLPWSPPVVVDQPVQNCKGVCDTYLVTYLSSVKYFSCIVVWGLVYISTSQR